MMSLTHTRQLSFAVLALVGLAAGTSRADIVTQLGDAADYGVLTGPSIHNFQTASDVTITGNVGIGLSANGLDLGGGKIVGNLNFADSSFPTGNGNTVNGTVTGSTNYSQSDVTTAYDTAKTLSGTLATETGKALSSSLFTNTGTAQNPVYTLSASQGTYDTSTGNYVFTIAASDFKNLGAFTISGTAAQNVVINITGNNEVDFSNAISVSGGMTDNNILYNVTGDGQIKGAAVGATVNGTILGIDNTFNMDSVVIDGRVIGGASGADFQLTSNFYLNQPTVATPEPSAFVLALTGGIAGLAYRYRRARGR